MDDLERLEYVERRPAPSGRRSRIAAIAPAGLAALRETDDAARSVTEEPTGALSAAERETLYALLPRAARPDER